MGQFTVKTRWLAGIIGVVVAAAGVVATFRNGSDAGATALVAGGLVVALAALLGGVRSVKLGDAEVVFAEAQERVAAGDNEGARARETELRIRARADQPYYPAVLLALTQVVHRLGLELHLPSDAESLPVIKGSRVAVDIRAGTDFQPAQCRPFYERLLTTRAPPYTGALCVVNAGPEDPVVLGLRALEPQFLERLAVADWRAGDRPESLELALTRLMKAQRESPGPEEPEESSA